MCPRMARRLDCKQWQTRRLWKAFYVCAALTMTARHELLAGLASSWLAVPVVMV